jgi:hypothetical protein
VRSGVDWLEWDVDHHQRREWSGVEWDWGGRGVGGDYLTAFQCKSSEEPMGIPRAGMELKRFSTMQTTLNVCPGLALNSLRVITCAYASHLPVSL